MESGLTSAFRTSRGTLRWTGRCREGPVHELRNSFNTIDELRVFADRGSEGHLIKILEMPDTSGDLEVGVELG